jgi:hypothetical protein
MVVRFSGTSTTETKFESARIAYLYAASLLASPTPFPPLASLSRSSRSRRYLHRSNERGCITGINRSIFLNRTNVKSLDVAQARETLYYFSAGFLTFKQSDFTSCLSLDRPLLSSECRVAARVTLMTASDTWNPTVSCRGANERWHSWSISEYRALEEVA